MYLVSRIMYCTYGICLSTAVLACKFSLPNGHVHIYPYLSSDPTGPPRTPSRVENVPRKAIKVE